MPFADASFDGAIMLHVGMNIGDKTALFSEVYRVLRPGAAFGIYDVMQTGPGELAYPVPWTADSGSCRLATPDDYRRALHQAGFVTTAEQARRDFALEFFRRMRARMEADGGAPPLGLHILMRENAAEKIRNMVENIAANLIAPVEMVARKA